MVFKLVRIDTQEPSKTQLSVGKHIIGRGKFLHNDDTDKRVSRNHAELEVTGDTVTLKSLHQNPCFYIKKNTTETELLLQDCTVSLCHGDKFGLLPDYFWYEVLHCNELDAKEGTRINETNETGLANEHEHRMQETEEASHGRENGETITFVENEEAADPNRSSSPSVLTAGQESTQEYEVKPQVPSDIDMRSPAKRSHSSRESSPVDVKKVKTEPIDAASLGAGPSNSQVASSDSQKKDKDAPASPAKPNMPLRERCIYGANCYRRNPQHKAQFSHPSDSDWGGGERGVCPYGRQCRRTDPRHWAHHEHPPGVLPPHQHDRPGMQVVRRHGNVFFINAHSVNFYDDHFQVEDSDGDSVDYDYEF